MRKNSLSAILRRSTIWPLLIILPLVAGFGLLELRKVLESIAWEKFAGIPAEILAREGTLRRSAEATTVLAPQVETQLKLFAPEVRIVQRGRMGELFTLFGEELPAGLHFPPGENDEILEKLGKPLFCEVSEGIFRRPLCVLESVKDVSPPRQIGIWIDPFAGVPTGVLVVYLLLLSPIVLAGCIAMGRLRARVFSPIRRMVEELDVFIGSDNPPQANRYETGAEPEICKLSQQMIRATAAKARGAAERGNLRRELLSEVVHDLRAPLGNVFLMLHSNRLTSSPEFQLDFRREVSKATAGQGHLIDFLRKLSKNDLDSVELQIEPIQLNEIAEEIIQTKAHDARLRNGSIELRSAPSLPPVLVDRGLIERVLVNLIDNALAHGGDGRDLRVVVEIEAVAAGVHVSVSDNGVGIPEAELQKLFSRFYRVEKTCQPSAGGFPNRSESTGLGLSIVQRILGLHHTRCIVSSEPGAGSRFSFLLYHQAERTIPKVSSELGSARGKNIVEGMRRDAAELLRHGQLSALATAFAISLPAVFGLQKQVETLIWLLLVILLHALPRFFCIPSRRAQSELFLLSGYLLFRAIIIGGTGLFLYSDDRFMKTWAAACVGLHVGATLGRNGLVSLGSIYSLFLAGLVVASRFIGKPTDLSFLFFGLGVVLAFSHLYASRPSAYRRIHTRTAFDFLILISAGSVLHVIGCYLLASSVLHEISRKELLAFANQFRNLDELEILPGKESFEGILSYLGSGSLLNPGFVVMPLFAEVRSEDISQLVPALLPNGKDLPLEGYYPLFRMRGDLPYLVLGQPKINDQLYTFAITAFSDRLRTSTRGVLSDAAAGQAFFGLIAACVIILPWIQLSLRRIDTEMSLLMTRAKVQPYAAGILPPHSLKIAEFQEVQQRWDTVFLKYSVEESHIRQGDEETLLIVTVLLETLEGLFRELESFESRIQDAEPLSDLLIQKFLQIVARYRSFAEDMLDLARLGEESPSLERSNIDLRSVLDELLLAFAAGMPWQRVTIRLCAPEMLIVHTHPELLQRTLSQLIRRTLGELPRRSLRIEVQQSEGRILIAIVGEESVALESTAVSSRLEQLVLKRRLTALGGNITESQGGFNLSILPARETEIPLSAGKGER